MTTTPTPSAARWLSERDPDGITGPEIVECWGCGEYCNHDAGEIQPHSFTVTDKGRTTTTEGWFCMDCIREDVF